MTTLTALFETRQMAELAVERLVQEYGLDRKAISITAAGAENTAGEAAAPERPKPADAARNGKIEVTVHPEHEEDSGRIRAAFKEFQANAGVED